MIAPQWVGTQNNLNVRERRMEKMEKQKTRALKKFKDMQEDWKCVKTKLLPYLQLCLL